MAKGNVERKLVWAGGAKGKDSHTYFWGVEKVTVDGGKARHSAFVKVVPQVTSDCTVWGKAVYFGSLQQMRHLAVALTAAYNMAKEDLLKHGLAKEKAASVREDGYTVKLGNLKD